MKGMKAYVLDFGSMKVDLNLFVAGSVQGSALDPTPQVKWVDIPMYCVLVDHPTVGKFLFDLGANPDCVDKEKWPVEIQVLSPATMGPGQDMVTQLSRCGTKPEEIQHVILSHLHWDHTGSMRLFEHCDIYAPEKDLATGMVKIHSSAVLSEQFPYYRGDLNVPVKHFYPVTAEEERIEFFPGVHLLNLPGHTAGMLGMLLELEGGNLLFPSDACYQRGNLYPALTPSGIVYDSLSYIHSLGRIKKYAEAYKAQIMYSHDWDFYCNQMKKAPDCYQ